MKDALGHAIVTALGEPPRNWKKGVDFELMPGTGLPFEESYTDVSGKARDEFERQSCVIALVSSAVPIPIERGIYIPATDGRIGNAPAAVLHEPILDNIVRLTGVERAKAVSTPEFQRLLKPILSPKIMMTIGIALGASSNGKGHESRPRVLVVVPRNAVPPYFHDSIPDCEPPKIPGTIPLVVATRAEGNKLALTEDAQVEVAAKLKDFFDGLFPLS